MSGKLAFRDVIDDFVVGYFINVGLAPSMRKPKREFIVTAMNACCFHGFPPALNRGEFLLMKCDPYIRAHRSPPPVRISRDVTDC